MSHPYSALSPNVIMTAIERLGIQPDGEPFALNSYENRVLMLRDETGHRRIVKFYRPERWSNATINEEHDYLDELYAAGVPVGKAWRTPDGVSLHEYAGFRFALFDYCAGQAPELDNPEHLFAMGQLIGKMHDVARQGVFQHRPSLSVVQGMAAAQQQVMASGHLTRHQGRAYERISSQLMKRIETTLPASVDMIRCHGDCHLGNVLGRETHFSLVDFDDCLMAPAVQDIWMLLAVDEPQVQRAQLSELREGYEESLPFPDHQLALVEPLRSYRLMRHSAWLVQRWDDPAFPLAFPWFASSGYWDQQIRQLEQQQQQVATPKWLSSSGALH